MTRNNATIGMFLASAVMVGAGLGTGVAPTAFGSGVAPQQATAANWSLVGGITAAVGGIVNLLLGKYSRGITGPIKSVTDVLADGKISRDEILGVVKDFIGSADSGTLGGTIKNVVDVAKKTEQASAEAAIDLLAGLAGVRGDAEVSALLTEVGAIIKSKWYGGTDVLPPLSPSLLLGLLKLDIGNDKLGPILDVIRGRLIPSTEVK